MIVTRDQMAAVMPEAGARIDIYLDHLNACMDEFAINNAIRVDAFLAQLGHESGQLRYVREIASGEAYEGRVDLGNVHAGDGVKYKGRGLIQITGFLNYLKVLMALGIDCMVHPELLETPENACRVSGWFWQDNGLNEIADAGNFETITRRINGGLNGESDRLALWEIAKKVIV